MESIGPGIGIRLALSPGAIAWFRVARFCPAEWALRTFTHLRRPGLRALSPRDRAWP